MFEFFAFTFFKRFESLFEVIAPSIRVMGSDPNSLL
jgi:hypothetical protein